MNYEDGLSEFQTEAPDICIPDIDLGRGRKSGIELAEAIRVEDEKIPIIFLTANYTEDYYEQSVLFFYADKKTTLAHTASATHILEVSLKTLEARLNSQFVRIHKSYLVNLEAIESINPKEGILTVRGHSLPIGYVYRSNFFKRINISR